MSAPVNTNKPQFQGTWEQYYRLPYQQQQRYSAPPRRDPVMYRRTVTQEQPQEETPQPRNYWETPLYYAPQPAQPQDEYWLTAQQYYKAGQYSKYSDEVNRLFAVGKITEEQRMKALKANPAPLNTAYAIPYEEYVALRAKQEKKDSSSITGQILAFTVFEFGQELGLNLFGVTDQQKRKELKAKNPLGFAKQAGKGLPLFEDPIGAVAGIVGSFESWVNPNVPTVSGAIVAEVGAMYSGKGGGDTQRLYDEYGASYIAGNIIGDLIQSYAIGKGISYARSTKIGGKVLNPVLKPFDVVDDYVRKKVLTPTKTKFSQFYDDVAKKLGVEHKQITGWKRTGFGMEGYSFDETYTTTKSESIFKTSKPSVIVDETGEKFLPQTARATSNPVTVTSYEQTVWKVNDKPYISIIKHPANPIGGGQSILVRPQAQQPISRIVQTRRLFSQNLNRALTDHILSTIIKPSDLGGYVIGGAIVGTKPFVSSLFKSTVETETEQTPKTQQMQGLKVGQIQLQEQQEVTVTKTIQRQQQRQKQTPFTPPPALFLPPKIKFPKREELTRKRRKKRTSSFGFEKQLLEYPVVLPKAVATKSFKFTGAFKTKNPFKKGKVKW